MLLYFRVTKEITVLLSVDVERISFVQLRRALLSLQNMYNVLFEEFKPSKHTDFKKDREYGQENPSQPKNASLERVSQRGFESFANVLKGMIFY